MKSLKRKYLLINKRNEEYYLGWSTYTCFAKTIKFQKFSRRTIRDWFYKLVDTEDYPMSEANGLIRFLHELSNRSEDDTFRGVFSTERGSNAEAEVRDVPITSPLTNEILYKNMQKNLQTLINK